MQKTNLENVSVFNKKTVEEKACEVMNKKERKTYFVFSGGSNLEFDDTEREYYLDYTEDEIARIKNLFIEAYNDGLSADERVSTIEEVEKLIGLDELKGYHEDLDKLIDSCSTLISSHVTCTRCRCCSGVHTLSRCPTVFLSVSNS